jgi:hypothetical protein
VTLTPEGFAALKILRIAHRQELALVRVRADSRVLRSILAIQRRACGQIPRATNPEVLALIAECQDAVRYSEALAAAASCGRAPSAACQAGIFRAIADASARGAADRRLLVKGLAPGACRSLLARGIGPAQRFAALLRQLARAVLAGNGAQKRQISDQIQSVNRAAVSAANVFDSEYGRCAPHSRS